MRSASLPRERIGAVIVAALLACTTSLFAQPPTEPGPPEFLIETITVESAHKISAEIVISESLLEEGSSYTESELRDARYRIVRLPFLLDAEFSLRKGSERGLYQLVITVEETRRWFFGFDLCIFNWRAETILIVQGNRCRGGRLRGITKHVFIALWLLRKCAAPFFFLLFRTFL